MNYTFFKDVLFDLINECNAFDIVDLIVEDKGNQIIVFTEEGKKFKVSLSDESESFFASTERTAHEVSIETNLPHSDDK